MWKKFRRFIINKCDEYLMHRNWHYWEPQWDHTHTYNKSWFDENDDPVVEDYAPVNWPPGYKGHKCKKCGQVVNFRGNNIIKKLKSRGCPKLPS